MNKKILLNNHGLILIKEDTLSLITNDEDNLKIDDFDFVKDAKNIHDFAGQLIYTQEESLFTFDFESGDSKKVMDLEHRKLAVDQDQLYLARFLDGVVTIEVYNTNFTLETTHTFTQFEESIAYFDEEYPIMVNLWEDDEEYTNIQPIITGFSVEDELFAFTINKNLYFGDFSKDSLKYIEIPQTSGMDVELYLRKPSITLHGTDGELSIDFTITQLPFRKKRRGGIEKIEIKLLKRGADSILPSVSEKGDYWFGVEGENTLYPIIINLKKNMPLVVFDEAVNKNHGIVASKNFKSLYTTDFETELKMYEWNKEGIFLEYIVDLME